MKLLKFGGTSLANGQGIQNAVSIIENKIKNKEKIVVVLSARGETTNKLEALIETAKAKKDYTNSLESFKRYQLEPFKAAYLSEEFEVISQILKGVELTGDYSPKTKDLLLAQGELLATKTVASILNSLGINSTHTDSRAFLKTDDNYGNANLNHSLSKRATGKYFKKQKLRQTPIITGFIASDENNQTTTLGRNGSNYSASLIANFLNIPKIESYTNVSGVYTANPKLVHNAKSIKHINYNEASELASFGASILHSKSISPLVDKKISLQILNTFSPESNGTLISDQKNPTGIKSISIQDDVALMSITGKGLLGKLGVDARIFSSLSSQGINIGIISQGSSERGVSFVIPRSFKTLALRSLKEAFRTEITTGDIQEIKARDSISVITVVGQSIADFSSSLKHLKENKINILLINNTLSGNNISIVLEKKDVKKAVNVIHAQIFGAIKRINIAIIGKGTVGGSLIGQILKARDKIIENKNLNLNIFAIAGSKSLLLDKNGIGKSWKAELEQKQTGKNISQAIIDYADKHHLENLIAIDNTASEEFVDSYNTFIENGFDLISSNKIANTQDYSKYKDLRNNLKRNKKRYLYETNVGAGLPIIDTIKTLHESGENIIKIKGVFSGSLSYLFNSFSDENKVFSYFLKNAIRSGYTEPDPREDLSGNDVARKLLILARELELENEFDDIEIENLIPEQLRAGSTEHFLDNIEETDAHYANIKAKLNKGEVLRYTGELTGDLQQRKGRLRVALNAVAKNSALGNLKGSDSIFEIYTESYDKNPITIIGAGAGAEVTARGVFGDLLRISEKK